MSLLRQLSRGLRVLARRRAADRDVDDEVRHFLDEAAAAHVARGLSPQEARRAARLELGSETAVRDEVRASGWEDVVGTSLADLRLAARRLRREPGFTAVAVLTLALGIGASTAIFSAVHPILFAPLPYPQPERVITLWDRGPDGAPLDVTFGTFREVLARSRAWTALAVMRPWQPTVTGAAEPERLEGQRVSAGYFRALGVRPARGRDLTAEDDRPTSATVAILSDALWRRRFGADPSIVGRQVRLDDDAYTVVGIMPPGFENVLAPGAELWTALRYDPALPLDGREWGHHLRMVGRLREGVDLDGARRELETIARSPLPEYARPPWAAMQQGLVATALQDDLTRGVRPALLAILGAVVLLLAIACVNVTNLLLARGVHRRGEMALRVALGAGRARLVRQLVAESLLLGAMGGVVGVAVAALGVRALVALSPPGLPRVGAIAVDGSAFAFALAVTTVIGLVFGLDPARRAAGGDLHRRLQDASRRTVGGHRRARGMLVVAEVALALMLLVSSGLLLRSLQRLFAVPVGFEARGLVTLQVQASGHRFDDKTVADRFFAEALEAVRRVPGVAAAGMTSQLPLSGDSSLYGIQLVPTGDDPGEVRGTFRYAVSPGYLEAMGIPLRRGRSLDERDRADTQPVVVVSESLARRRLRGLDPLGRQLVIGADETPHTIVGVVADVKQESLALSDAEAVYLPAVQWPYGDRAMSLVVRGRGDATALLPAIRRAVWSVDADQPIVRVARMDDLVAASAAERRFVLVVFAAFALAALVLATAGIYGVLAGSVAERTREIGVCSALGASRRAILSLVVRQGMTLVGIGALLGLLGAAGASRAVAAMLFGVSRFDPATYAGVVALLAAAAVAACAVPAWRAVRVDPASTLRAE